MQAPVEQRKGTVCINPQLLVNKQQDYQHTLLTQYRIDDGGMQTIFLDKELTSVIISLFFISPDASTALVHFMTCFSKTVSSSRSLSFDCAVYVVLHHRIKHTGLSIL